MRSIGWQKGIDFVKNLTSTLTLKFSHSELFSGLSSYIYCYVVTIISLLTPAIHYTLKIAMCDDTFSVHKLCPEVNFMCELHVRMKLYGAACSLSDAGSHFFRNRNKSPSRIFSYKCSIAQVHLGTNDRNGKEYLAGTLREFFRDIIWNNVCKPAWKLQPSRSLNMKFGTRSNEEKLYRLQNDCEFSVWLQPTKLWEKHWFIITVRHCVHCKTWRKCKENLHITFSCITGTETNMLLIVFLGLIVKLALVSGDCDLGTPTLHDFDYSRVGIGVLTYYWYKQLLKLLLCFIFYFWSH